MTIKETRENAGLSRKRVAELLDIPYRTLQNWELGSRECPEWAEKLITEKLQELADDIRDSNIMTRANFIKIIKIRSIYQTGEGNYRLPNGVKLSEYITELVEGQLDLDKLVISENGDLYPGWGGEWNDETKSFDDYTVFVPFGQDETCGYDRYQFRIRDLVDEIIEE